MTKRSSWTRQETLELLDILRTSCASFLDGTDSNVRGEMYRYIENEWQRRDPTMARNPRQIENKWITMKFLYQQHKQELDLGMVPSRPYDYLKEMEELFFYIDHRNMMDNNPTVETLNTVEDITCFDDFVAEESQDLSVDEDAVVIEEIVYDSQDAIEFDDTPAAATSSTIKPLQKRKKLTMENMEVLIEMMSSMQKKQDETFIRKQMDLVENEFESFREKEQEHWVQLKVDLEQLKVKYLERIQRIGHGDAPADAQDEQLVQEAKRRRIVAVTGRRK